MQNWLRTSSILLVTGLPANRLQSGRKHRLKFKIKQIGYRVDVGVFYVPL